MSHIVLFTSLQDYSYDPVQLAENFIREGFSEKETNVELTHLLLQSCGIGDRIPENLIVNKSYDDIMDFFDEKLTRTQQTSVPLRNAKYYDRFSLFFERIISLNWNTLTNSGNFDGYLPGLMNVLAFDDYLYLHVSCFAIKLKFVTGYLKSDGEKQHMKAVQNYAKVLLRDAISYMSIQCPLSALNELLVWIKIDATFARDEYLRIIAWSLKMEKPKLICCALQTAYTLLSMNNFRGKLSLFVRKLTTIFEDLCFTTNTNIFDWICRCCVLIYKNYKEVLSQSFIDDLLDNLFAEDRERAKVAARFWMDAMFEGKPPIFVIRKILKFISNRTRSHAKILVDSLLDDFQMMTDWKLFVKILTDVTRSSLNIEERHHVLLLMSYAVDEITTGVLPAFRHDKKKKLDASVCLKHATRFTKIIVPNLRALFSLEYSDKEHAKTILLHMATRFNFTIMDGDHLKLLIDQCILLLQQADHAPAIGVAFDLLLRLVSKDVSDESINCESDKTLKKLVTCCENDFEALVNDFVANPNKYADLENENVQETASILWSMYILNEHLCVDKKYGFDIPRLILEHEFLPDNPVFLYLTYVCISLITEYVLTTVKKLKTSSETDFVAPEEHEDDMVDIDFAIKFFSLRLKDWYFSDLGLLAFFKLCEILIATRSLKLRQNTRKTLLPSTAQYLITAYVSHAVCEMNQEFVIKNMTAYTKTLILKSYLDLISSDILPLTHAYDVMMLRCKMPTIIDKPLRTFLLTVSREKSKKDIVEWLLQWLECLSTLSHEDCLDIVKDFAELIVPIKKQIQEIIYYVHVGGIEYSLSDSSRNELFLQILSELCVCLDMKNKKAIYEYFVEKRSTADRKIWANYIKCLKKQSRFQPVASHTPVQSCNISEDEHFINSPPPSNIPSSIQADESDLMSSPLRSPLSSERSLYIIRSINDIHARVSGDSEIPSQPRSTDRVSNASRMYAQFKDTEGIIDLLEEGTRPTVIDPMSEIAAACARWEDIDQMSNVTEAHAQSSQSRSTDRVSSASQMYAHFKDTEEIIDLLEEPIRPEDIDQMSGVLEAQAPSEEIDQIDGFPGVYYGKSKDVDQMSNLNNMDQISGVFELPQSDDTRVSDVIEEIQNFVLGSDSDTDPSPSKKMRFSESSYVSDF